MLQSVPREGDPRHPVTPTDLVHAAIPNTSEATKIRGLLFPRILPGRTGCHKSHLKQSKLINLLYQTPSPEQGLFS